MLTKVLFSTALLFAAPTAAARTMQAMRAHGYVGKHFNKLSLDNVTIPSPGKGEVLIKVNGSSVNPVDWKIIELPITKLSFPQTLGFDVAGTVEAVGAGASGRLKTGDRVWVDVADTGLGAYAEFVVAKESETALAPTSIGTGDAATLPLVALTSLQALQKAGAPFPEGHNTSVIISAGSGGTGFTGIQMAKAYGCFVITACGTDHVEFCKGLGADVVVDYHKQSLWDVVSDSSVDVVYENLGASGTADKGMDKLKDNGVYVYIAGEKPTNPKPGVKVIFFLTDSSNYSDLDQISLLVDAGQLKPVIQQVFPLSQVPAAFQMDASSGVAGKLAIAIGY